MWGQSTEVNEAHMAWRSAEGNLECMFELVLCQDSKTTVLWYGMVYERRTENADILDTVEVFYSKKKIQG